MRKERLTTITLEKENLKFSAAHFTIFSAHKRERLHGHNFFVRIKVTAPVGNNGMTFSYKLLKDRLIKLCGELDEYLILPGLSPYLSIKEDAENYVLEFNGEQMVFLKSDSKVLPIINATVEEYAAYLSRKLAADTDFLEQFDIREILLEVSSGAGQWGSATWDSSSCNETSEAFLSRSAFVDRIF